MNSVYVGTGQVLVGTDAIVVSPYYPPDLRLKKNSPAIGIIKSIPVQNANEIELISYGSVYLNKYQDASSRLEPYDAGALPVFEGEGLGILLLLDEAINQKGEL